MGTLLFILAALAIVLAPLIGLAWGPGRMLMYRLRSRDLAPRVDTSAAPITTETTIDFPAPSLLTSRPTKGGAPEPYVCIDGADYRVTRVDASRYLVTERRESRRLGFFELVTDTDHAEIVPEPDDPANGFLLVRIAVAAARTRPGA
jgi:hypothetical protein